MNLAAFLLVFRVCQALTVHGTVQQLTGLIGSTESLHVPLIVHENCRTKLPSGGVLQNVTLVTLNYSLVDFTYGKNPPEFPQRMENVTSLQALIYNSVQFGGLTFLEDALEKISDRGFDAFVYILSGDESWNSWLALRVWRTKYCPVPTYFLKASDASQNSIFLQNSDGEYVVSDLDFDANAVVSLIRSPAYILGITVPAYILAIVIASISSLKLYRSGFPYNQSNGSLLCCIGSFYSLLMSKVMNYVFGSNIGSSYSNI
jgi:hypothetical protein